MNVYLNKEEVTDVLEHPQGRCQEIEIVLRAETYIVFAKEEKEEVEVRLV